MPLKIYLSKVHFECKKLFAYIKINVNMVSIEDSLVFEFAPNKTGHWN